MSNAGQIAIIINDVLFVESSAGSNSFQQVDQRVVHAFWSDAGSELHYFCRENSNEETKHYLWLVDKKTTELVRVEDNIQFSAESTETLSQYYPLTSQTFLALEHCGAPCEELSVVDTQGNEIWHLPWATAGLFAISPDRTYLINIGRVDVEITNATVDKINLSTGDYEVIWQIPLVEGEYFSVFWEPGFSPDGKLINFNYGGPGNQPGKLFIIDSSGQTYWSLDPNSIFVDWQPNSNGLVAFQQLSEDHSQLLYLSVNEPISHTLTELKSKELVDGIWSMDSSQWEKVSSRKIIAALAQVSGSIKLTLAMLHLLLFLQDSPRAN